MTIGDQSVTPNPEPACTFDQRGQGIYGSQTNIIGDVTVTGGLANTGEIATGGGDVIISDKVIIQRLDPIDARNQRNHAALRQMVHSFWIDGVLKHSLYNEVLIRLNVQKSPNLVDNRPWDLILQRPDMEDQPIPSGTPILDIFDLMGQHLLILGEPGSGKTTMLLELADALLDQAAKDPLHPTPVIFNLSSWTIERKSLTAWLLRELRSKYNIPKKIAQSWINNNELLLLLDGLDEVQQEYRQACADAINDFRQEHLLPLTVCCRTNEYKSLAIQLKLHGAILVQPLTTEQIDAYMEQTGDNLTALHNAFMADVVLRSLSTSPLMLSIMTLAYQDRTEEISAVIGDRQSLHHHLFNTYIQRMFLHRGLKHLYPPQHTLKYLRWLSNHLEKRRQTIFLIEQIQPSWLSSKLQICLYVLVSRLCFALMFGAIEGLVFQIFHWWQNGNSITVLQQIFWGLTVGLAFATADIAQMEFRRNKHRLSSSFYESALYACIGGLITWLIIGVAFQLRFRLVFWIIAGIIWGIKFGHRALNEEINPIEMINWSFQRALKGGAKGTVWGLVIWGVIGMTFLQIGGLTRAVIMSFVRNLSGIETSSLVINVLEGSSFVLLTGLGVAIFSGLSGGVFESKTLPNQGIQLSRKYALQIGSIIGFAGGLFFGIMRGISVTLNNDWNTGLNVAKLDFIAFSMIIGLLTALWFGGITVIQHAILRLYLYLHKQIPWRYSYFLDYCVKRIFLRRVGGGYIFIHRLIMEHIASLTDDDIKRLTARLDKAD